VTGTALVLIEGGTHALFRCKHLIEQDFPLAETGKFLRLKPRYRLPRSPGNERGLRSMVTNGARRQNQSQEHEVKSVHGQYVPFPVWPLHKIFFRKLLVPETEGTGHLKTEEREFRLMIPRQTPAAQWVAKVLLLSVLGLQVGGCNVFETKDEIAKEARVIVSGTAPGTLELITSTKFERWVDEEGETRITLSVSDTVELDLTSDHDEIYPIKPDLGFYVKLSNDDPTPATISMQVYFDGELNYSQQNATLSESSLEFSFIFSNYNTVY
jgi:hypothetical protein